MATAKKGAAASPSTTAAKTVKKRIKKLPTGLKVTLALVLLFAITAGAGTAYFMTRNDRFTLDTNASLLFTDGDVVDRAALTCKVTAISLGKDISETLTTSTTLPETEGDTVHLTEGVYYTTYTVRTQFGRTIKRIQTITVMAAETAEGGESLG